MIVETRHRLREWGQWVSGGEPGLSSMFRSLFGVNRSPIGEIPSHIQEIDVIVCRLEMTLRVTLVHVYTKGGSLSSKAQCLGIARQTLKDRLERAEWAVNVVLDGFTESLAAP